jgi:hypothetical protein
VRDSSRMQLPMGSSHWRLPNSGPWHIPIAKMSPPHWGTHHDSWPQPSSIFIIGNESLLENQRCDSEEDLAGLVLHVVVREQVGRPLSEWENDWVRTPNDIHPPST